MQSTGFRILRERAATPYLLLMAVLGFLHLLCQSYILSLDIETITSSITIDDTYYYLQTAWNVREAGFPTFDGIHATNGFQFGWFLIVTAVAFLSASKTTLVYGTLAVSFILNALCFIPIWKIGVTVGRPSLALFTGMLWFLVTLGTSAYLIGMENSLHAFIFWTVLWQLTAFVLRVNKNQPFSIIGLTAWLVLNAWARLESGLFSALFFLYAVGTVYIQRDFQEGLRKWRRDTGKAVLVALLGLSAMLAIFYLSGGTFLPVSALVKQKWATWDYFFEGGIGIPGVAVLLLLAFVGWQMDRYYVPANWEMRALVKVWLILLAGVLVHLILTERTRAYSHYVWYLSPAIILLVIVAGITLDWIGDVLARRWNRGLRKAYQAVLTILLLGLSLSAFRIQVTDYIPLYQTRYQVALWMAQNLPEGAVCASWNAGQLGYYSERTVINLDGLINGFDYYEQVVNGPSEWPEYVRDEGVDCIVDYGDRIRGRPGFTLMYSFPIEGMRPVEFHIWRVNY